ncbi:MAG: AAA family ATPase [Chloroflexi bacterium]|nr:AAA family ATPase [Chloroflexota bacterium]
MTLMIHLLGKPKLLLDSTPLKFNAPPRTLPLLAYLLLHRRQALERQNVSYALWPDDSESNARTNLRRHIHQLQRVLPPADQPWLFGDMRTIRWNPESDFWLDVEEFEHLAAQPNHLEAAAACYTGDLLETVYDDWVFFERERLLNQYFDLLTRLVFQHRAGRDYPKAIGFARQLLNRDPFREDTLRQLIAVRYESGDRAGAIQEFKTFERRLRDEMGVTPMPETLSLHELVTRDERLPALDTPAASDPEPEAGRAFRGASLPFVGREREMERASAWWSRAARGYGGLSMIGGEAGVGKSRLARQVSLLVESQGGRVLVGRTSPQEARPYQAVIEAMQSVLPLLAAQNTDLMHMAALGLLIPELKSRMKLPDLPPLDAERERLRLFSAVAKSLEQLAAPRPLLLLLEDLHWAGEASAALVEFLARHAARLPILILCTYRDEETPRIHPLRQMRRKLQADLTVEHMALSRLSREAVDDLVGRIGNPPYSSSRLFSESEGNPLFIEMLVQSWSEGEATESVPGGIRAVIAAQLEKLPESARAFAETAAVLGPAFDAEATREVGGWDEAQSHEALRGLLDRRLVWETEGRSRFDYFFAHHLIQSVLYNEIPLAKRKRRHLRAAEVLEELHPEQRSRMAGELASHYDLGDAPAQAIPLYLEAARGHLTVFADAEALTVSGRALQLAASRPEVGETRTVFELIRLQEGIHHRRGERDEQRVALEKMERLTGELNDPELVCEATRCQIQFYRAVDDHPSQRAKVDLLQQQAKKMGSRYWQAEALFAEGNFRKITHEFPEAIQRLGEAAVFYREAQIAEAEVDCYNLLSEISIIQRHSAEAEAWAQKALALCEKGRPTHALLQTLWNLSANGLTVKDYERCYRYARQLLESAQQAHDLVWQAAAHRLMGMAYQRQFRIAEAHKSLNTALNLYQQVQKPKGQALTLQTIGHVEVSVGNHATAIQNYEQAYEINEKLRDQNGMASEAINISCAASFQGDYAIEKEYAQRAIPLARQIHSGFLEGMALQNLGEAERELGDLESARQHLAESLNFMDDATQIVERSSILSDLALTYWKAGDLPLAMQTAEQILSAYPEVEGKDDNVHRFLWVAARILHADGQADHAAATVAQAYAAFQKDAAAIPEAESRRSFAEIRHNRQIVAAHERGEWP